MFGEPAEGDELPESSGEYVQAKMFFKGDISGEISITIPTEMCAEIAANVIGTELDDEVAIARGLDSLKELLNVTCGQFLTSVAGVEPVFDLSVPETLEVDSKKWDELLNDDNSLTFQVDERPVVLSLLTEEQQG